MDQKQQSVIALALGLVLVIVAWALFYPPKTKITQGLDIQGGLSVILTAQETTSTNVTAAVMDRAELIVSNRVNKLGASEASIQKQGNESILVQLPGIKNAEEALKVLGSTGQLEFVDVETINDSATVAAIQSSAAGAAGVVLKTGTYTPIMTGDVVTNATVGTNTQTNKITVDVTMNNKGRDIWGQYTTSHVGKYVAIVLDGKVQSAPVVNEPITDGRTEISGSFTPAEAKNLKTVLETGALPVTLKFSDSRVVGPTLGQESLRAGVLAALAGVGLVLMYLLLFYRGLGLLSWIAMFGFASLFLGLLALLSTFGWFALSLPGIAGVVLTIGLAADSSILINERFREEVMLGKTIRSAAVSGTRHAIGTSIDADLVSFVSALVLYLVAIGPVRGFALTLMLGIGCDIIMMLLIKRPMVILLAEGMMTKMPELFGLKRGEARA